MAEFATEDELEDYTGISLSTSQADLNLQLATGTIRGWTDQNIYPSESLTETFYEVNAPPKRFRLPLPHPPVIPVTITSVVEDGTTLDAADYRLEPTNELVKVEEEQWDGDVTVNYSAGFDTVPMDVKAVTLLLASRGVSNPLGAQSVRIGDYSETFTARPVAATELTDGDKDTLRRYKLNASG